MEPTDRKQITVLYVQTIEISLLDIPRTLDELGYTVYKAALGVKAQGFDKEACNRIIDTIDAFGIQCAISYDFSESISQACFEAGIPYIAWVYDAPQQELYTHYAQHPCNYIFVFDRMQQKRLQEIGIQNVYHMPLAIHAGKIKVALEKGKASQGECTGEVAFVGQLYRIENLENLYENADISVKKALNDNIKDCFLKWNEDTKMHGLMNETCVHYFSDIDNHKIPKQCPYITEQFYYEAAVLSRLLAHRERVHILNALAEKYNVKFYTFDQNVEQLSDKVEVMKGAKYDFEVSNIYHSSKINLNITLHCIETGASQRIFDVMAAGGFMLSNYQQELAELFVPGEEIVLYHNMEELEYYVEYYLSHEEERKRIAKRGQQKVVRLHDFHGKIQKVMEIVSEKEKSRTQTYITIQKNWLCQKANACLKAKSLDSYKELYKILTNRKYETVLRKSAALGVLREMLECWQKELEIGDSHLFDDVDCLEQAEKKYLRIKHGMWRIEQGISENKCIEVVEMLVKEKVSKILVVWIVFANMKERENVLVKLSDYMRMYNTIEAVELLSYGLVLFPGNAVLALKKSECLMDLSMWKEALEVLYLIEQPDQNIRLLIQELENALQVSGSQQEQKYE